MGSLDPGRAAVQQARDETIASAAINGGCAVDRTAARGEGERGRSKARRERLTGGLSERCANECGTAVAVRENGCH